MRNHCGAGFSPPTTHAWGQVYIRSMRNHCGAGFSPPTTHDRYGGLKPAPHTGVSGLKPALLGIKRVPQCTAAPGSGRLRPSMTARAVSALHCSAAFCASRISALFQTALELLAKALRSSLSPKVG
jgi:hypothetical protein